MTGKRVAPLPEQRRKRTHILLPTPLWARLQQQAERDVRSMTDVIRRYCEEGLQREEARVAGKSTKGT
jgi:hypothetical protein